MSEKKCMVYETLGNISNIQRVTEAQDGLIRLTGVFGVCGVKNDNNRIYEKANYGKMVEALQKQIINEGCPGELEHPNSMNINLNNVSHKIESIEMHEDGTITGTIVLLNTDKGKNAQAMVEGGLPLYISSRGAGSIDESGHVTLTTIKTYDLVGTPGFAQAKLNLAKGQKFESLNESLDNGPISWAIIDESDDQKTEPKKDENNNNNNTNITVSMEDIKKSIDALTDRIAQLESQLHIAQESLQAANQAIEEAKVSNYAGIQSWLNEEWIPEFKNELIEQSQSNMENWINEYFAPLMDEYINEHLTVEITNNFKSYVNEEFASNVDEWITEHVQKEFEKNIAEELGNKIEEWITTEYAQTQEDWIKEELVPGIEKWIMEDYSYINSKRITEQIMPCVEDWITECFAPEVQNWITECFAPENTKAITDKINSDLSEYMESQKGNKYDNIDKILETLSAKAAALSDTQKTQLINESTQKDQYADSYVVANMPIQYRPMWESLNNEAKDGIMKSARMYDFTKANALESFWANQNFNATLIAESQIPQVQTPDNLFSQVAATMKRLRH